jgi:hypothetical protein
MGMRGGGGNKGRGEGKRGKKRLGEGTRTTRDLAMRTYIARWRGVKSPAIAIHQKHETKISTGWCEVSSESSKKSVARDIAKPCQPRRSGTSKQDKDGP